MAPGVTGGEIAVCRGSACDGTAVDITVDLSRIVPPWMSDPSATTPVAVGNDVIGFSASGLTRAVFE